MGTSGIRPDNLLLVSSHLYSRSSDLRPFEGSGRLGRKEVVMHGFVVDFNHVGKKTSE